MNAKSKQREAIEEKDLKLLYKTSGGTVRKKRSIDQTEKPKMYLKARHLLAGVKTDLSSDIIEDRGK